MFTHVSVGPVRVLGFCKYRHHLGTKPVCPECVFPNTNRFSCCERHRRGTWRAAVQPKALPGKKTKPVSPDSSIPAQSELSPQEALGGGGMTGGKGRFPPSAMLSLLSW